MKIERIEIDKLISHPENPNVMSEVTLAKLRGHIERSDYYEPLVVRPHPQKHECFELINGHHRREVLRQLGHKLVNCVVWPLADEEARMMLATINRLSGHDDPIRRAQLLEKLSQRYEHTELLKSLPEKRKQLEKMLDLNRPPKLNPPPSVTELPRTMTFFVSENQQKIIEKALNAVKEQVRGETGNGKMSRGDLIACMAQSILYPSGMRIPGRAGGDCFSDK